MRECGGTVYTTVLEAVGESYGGSNPLTRTKCPNGGTGRRT